MKSGKTLFVIQLSGSLFSCLSLARISLVCLKCKAWLAVLLVLFCLSPVVLSSSDSDTQRMVDRRGDHVSFVVLQDYTIFSAGSFGALLGIYIGLTYMVPHSIGLEFFH